MAPSRSQLPDFVNHCITNGSNHIPFHITNVLDLPSDHIPLCLSLFTDFIQFSHDLRPPIIPIQGPVEWLSLQSFLKSSLDLNMPLKSREDVNLAVQKIISDVQTSMKNKLAPYIHRYTATDIQAIRTGKNGARWILQGTRYPPNKTAC